MDYLSGIITVFLAIVALHLLTEILIKYKNIRDEKRNAYLVVLKYMTKCELYQRFNGQEEHSNFSQWLTTYLTMKEYTNIKYAINNGDNNTIDLIAINPYGQETYIMCKLESPGNSNNKTSLSLLKELVGNMVANSIKYGLFITMCQLDGNVLDYIAKVKVNGYNLKYIDAEEILKDLSDFRPKELQKLIQPI